MIQQTEDFLRHVWPEEGNYCIAVPAVTQDEHHYFKHKAFTSIELAAKYAQATESDCFYAVGTLKEAEIWDEKKQRSVTRRIGSNIADFKCLFLDIDCGDNKPYKTQQEGADALRKFCMTTSMPKPTIVGSGGGLHVYWVFTESVDADTWQEAAEKLNSVVNFFKFNADPSRVRDRSSVLRVAGTYNHKNDELRPVRVISYSEAQPFEKYTAILDKVIQFNNIKQVSHKPKNELHALFEGIVSNFGYEDNPANQEAIFRNCKQMQRVLEEGGTVGYNMRASAVSIIRCTKEQDYDCIFNDPDQETVEQQTEQMLHTTITDNPHTCARIEFENPGGCDGCEHKGRIKSPVVLGYKPKESVITFGEVVPESTEQTQESTEQPVEITCPDPYRHDSFNGVYMITTNEFGDANGKEVIHPFEMYPVKRMFDTVSGCETVEISVKFPADGIRTFELPLSLLADKRSFGKEMSHRGVLNTDDKMDALRFYFVSYIARIQEQLKATVSYQQLGWHDDKTKFVLPDQTFLDDGTVIRSSLTKSALKSTGGFGQRGSFEEWRKVISLYERPGFEQYAFGHLVGYASLLFSFTEYDGAVVNFVSPDSGSGKTTILRTIASLFGDPHPNKMMLLHQDTLNAKYNRIAIYQNIASMYDEITSISEEECSNLAYSISSGRAKYRLDANSTEKEDHRSWSMLMASTSNSSLLSKLSNLKSDSTAESMRIFEYFVNTTNLMTKEEADEHFAPLRYNYGHAGPMFIKEIITQQDKVQQLIRACTAEFDKRANVSIRERFWSSIVGCVMASGIIGKRIGLNNFDMERLLAWTVKQVTYMRNIVNEAKKTPVSLLVEYINQNIANTLVVGGGVGNKPTYVMSEPTSKLMLRSEKDIGIMYIDRTALRQWLVSVGADWSTVRRSLMENKIVINDNAPTTLSKGSSTIQSAQVRCWLIDMKVPALAGVTLEPVAKPSVVSMQGVEANMV